MVTFSPGFARDQESHSEPETSARFGNSESTQSENTVKPGLRYRVGRLLQFVGLLILPFGIASELVGRVGLGQSLLIAGAGALVFYAGYVIQNRT